MTKTGEVSERSEQLLEFLKNTIKQVLHNFDPEFPKMLERMPKCNFLEFMVLIETGNSSLAIWIYEAILNCFSYDDFHVWKGQQDKKIHEQSFEKKGSPKHVVILSSYCNRK